MDKRKRDKMIRAVIFDFNGVLDRINEERIKAIEDVLEEINSNLKKHAAEVLVDIEMIDKYNPSDTMKNIVAKAFAKFFEKKKIKSYNAEKFSDMYMKAREKYKGIKSTVKDVLEYLKNKDMKMFIVSHSKKADILNLFLNHNISVDLFDAIYSTQDLGLKKPNIEILEKIIRENNLNPENCMFIGDNITEDMMPAKAMNMRTVLISDFVDEFISDIDDIKKLV